MNKTKSHAFGKDVYLLGQDEQNIYYWLESPKRDCTQYWESGYIVTYTNNKYPHLAKNINLRYGAKRFMPKYFTSWHDSEPVLEETTFNNKEGWELSELFSQFLFLRKAAENFTRGNCDVANTAIQEWKKPKLVKEINEVLISQVTKRIMDILTPEE